MYKLFHWNNREYNVLLIKGCKCFLKLHHIQPFNTLTSNSKRSCKKVDFGSENDKW